jgi:rhodanese-related sulfurtransferase
MKKMGIGDGMHIVVYDSEGLYSAARVWWMFRTMGHEEVRVLNGGLKKWRAEGRPLEDGPPRQRTPRHFTPVFNAGLVRDAAEVKALIGNPAAQIVDARAAARFEGSVAEPRAGLRSGHIPTARSLPFASLLNADGTLKPASELRQIFAAAKVDPERPVVASCGSGVTAGVIALALAISGARMRPSMMAPGRSGARTPRFPLRLDRRDRGRPAAGAVARGLGPRPIRCPRWPIPDSSVSPAGDELPIITRYQREALRAPIRLGLLDALLRR